MHRAMAEWRFRQLAAECLDRGLMGGAAQRDDDLQLGQAAQMFHKIGPAGVNFGGFGLVGGRHTAHGVGDEGAVQCNAIGRIGGIITGAEPEFGKG